MLLFLKNLYLETLLMCWCKCLLCSTATINISCMYKPCNITWGLLGQGLGWKVFLAWSRVSLQWRSLIYLMIMCECFIRFCSMSSIFLHAGSHNLVSGHSLHSLRLFSCWPGHLQSVSVDPVSISVSLPPSLSPSLSPSLPPSLPPVCVCTINPARTYTGPDQVFK